MESIRTSEKNTQRALKKRKKGVKKRKKDAKKIAKKRHSKSKIQMNNFNIKTVFDLMKVEIKEIQNKLFDGNNLKLSLSCIKLLEIRRVCLELRGYQHCSIVLCVIKS